MRDYLQNKLNIEHVPINSLKKSEYNPRKITAKQEADLTESIKRFGFVDPIIVNAYRGRENIVIGGHMRLDIALKLKYKEVPVVYVSLPLEKEKELNLRLNRNTGEWDVDLLKGMGIDLLLDVGFDETDFDKIFDEILETEDDGFNVEKELAKIKTTNITL
jgi:ParB-like chromosome segregation protein Spo0J